MIKNKKKGKNSDEKTWNMNAKKKKKKPQVFFNTSVKVAKSEKSLRNWGLFLCVFELKKSPFLGAFFVCFFYLDTTRHYFGTKSGRVVGLRPYALKGLNCFKNRISTLRFQKKRLALFPSRS